MLKLLRNLVKNTEPDLAHKRTRDEVYGAIIFHNGSCSHRSVFTTTVLVTYEPSKMHYQVKRRIVETAIQCEIARQKRSAIGFLPTPYPDELLYSICARYGETVGYESRTRVVKELFGSESAALVDLPVRLNHLLGKLPNQSFNLDLVVAKYTLFRFYAPFSFCNRVPLLVQSMGSAAGRSLRIRVGVANSGFKLPSALRFCPQCASEDRETYGETYWHRIHQLTTIDVCAIHGTLLEDSEVLKNGWTGKRGFVPADGSVPSQAPRILSRTDAFAQMRLRLASDVKWLLDYDGDPPGLTVLRERYRNLLLELGYAHHKGHIKVKKLLESFQAFYPEAFLSPINCSISYGPRNWLAPLLSRDNNRSIQHPIRHLLLINFLGQTAQRIFTEFSEYKPFGDGPWLCHNKAAVHFGQPVIKDCRVLDSPRTIGAPYGVFSCECGFVYTRHGAGPVDNLRHSAVLSYGQCWEDTLRRIWNDPKISLNEGASRLGVVALSVVRHAIRLGLSTNTPDGRKICDYILNRYKHFNPQREEVRRKHREGWVAIVGRHPDFSRSELIRASNSSYLWLRRFDSLWLESHLPPVRRRAYVRPKNGRVNWEKEDLELSTEIERVARQIRSITPPVHVAAAAIIRKIGHRHWIESARSVKRPFSKLPRTTAILGQCLEPLVNFQIRKLEWATDSFREQRVCPTRYQLVRKAKIRNKSARAPRVQNRLTAALESLAR